MKLFGRTSGYYIFWTGFVYLVVGIICAFTHALPSEYITLGFLLALSVPLIFPPVARYFNMEPVMFDLFRRKTAKEYLDEAKDASNVYNLPKPKAVPPMPEVEPPKKEEPAKIFYRLGLTDNNRIAFSMGYSEITMNKAGCQQMIDQIEFFMGQLYDEDDSPDDPDGGESVPVPKEERKAA